MASRLWKLAVLGVLAGLLVPVGGSAGSSETPRVYVVVVDGLEPDHISLELTPNLYALANSGDARTYSNAQAIMVTETNSNHAAIVTGAYGQSSGIFANSYLDTTVRPPVKRALDRPSLLLSETLYDAIDRQGSNIVTGAVMGKAKVRNLLAPTATTSDNPERVPVRHAGPDHLWGASERPDGAETINGHDSPAEAGTGSGYAADAQIMSSALQMVVRHDPAFLFVSLSNVDGFQHLLGVNNPLARAAVANADVQVGRLVDLLRSSERWGDSVLIVTADHSFQATGDPVGTSTLGGNPVGPDVDVSNHPTTRVTGTTINVPELLGNCPSTQFGWVTHGGSMSVYVTDPGFDGYDPAQTLTAEQAGCLKTLRERVVARRGVTGAYYRLHVEGDQHLLSDTGWNVQTPRAGELLVTADDIHTFLESPTSSHSASPGVHGGPTARPVGFIVASGSEFLVPGADPTAVSLVDIAPTAAWVLGVEPPSGSEGRILREAFTRSL